MSSTTALLEAPRLPLAEDRDAPPLSAPDWLVDPASLLAQPDGDAPPPFTESEAHYVIDRITTAQERIARFQAQVATMIAQELTDLHSFLGWENRSERLELWTAEHLTGKRRTVTTLYGSVGYGKQSARCRVTDATKAVTWLREHCPEAVAEKPVAAKLPKPTREVDPATGEVTWIAPCEGLEAVGECERFKVNGKLLKADDGADAAQEGEES